MTRADSPADPPSQRRADRQAHRGRGGGFPILLVTVAALGVAQAAAWFYFRKNQPVTDELTRDRLRRWSDN
jgi:hypothetical protein